ncbi:Uncharacterised protein [Turicibacter sanguinis]|nr:Uncharacterised protein [Turicibacter sanguinis]
MKYINKYIALGLGFALMFTATNFAHSMFTSRAVQENTITIPRNLIEVLVNEKAYFYHKKQGRFLYLYIPIKVIGDINDLKISTEIDNTKYNWKIGDREDNSIKYLIIENTSEFPTKDSFKFSLSITTTSGQNLISESYTITKNNNGNSGGNGPTAYQVVEISKYDNNNNRENLNQEGVEATTEEIEVPSEEGVEATTEEIEVSSEEVVEPSTEEIKAPSEIEVVLPSREETEIEE